jgi:hypothetical protein
MCGGQLNPTHRSRGNEFKMSNSISIHIKNFLAVASLLLSLAALQSPLWRPEPTPSLTAKAGDTLIFPYQGELQRALIFQKEMATLSGAVPGQLAIHTHSPGKTRMLIRFKDGASKVYDLVVLPAKV